MIICRTRQGDPRQSHPTPALSDLVCEEAGAHGQAHVVGGLERHRRPRRQGPDHDYNPVWAHCQELGLASASVPGMARSSRVSVTESMYNRIGYFPAASEAVRKALLFGGVTRRRSKLRFMLLRLGWRGRRRCSQHATPPDAKPGSSVASIANSCRRQRWRARERMNRRMSMCSAVSCSIRSTSRGNSG